jgi:hypothetical protein
MNKILHKGLYNALRVQKTVMCVMKLNKEEKQIKEIKKVVHQFSHLLCIYPQNSYEALRCMKLITKNSGWKSRRHTVIFSFNVALSSKVLSKVIFPSSLLMVVCASCRTA